MKWYNYLGVVMVMSVVVGAIIYLLCCSFWETLIALVVILVLFGGMVLWTKV